MAGPRQAYFSLPGVTPAQSCDLKGMREGPKARETLLSSTGGWYGPVLDFLIGAGPWLLAVGIAAAGLTALIETSEGAEQWLKENLVNDNAISALSSMLAFLVVARISANLSQNSSVVGMFGSLCGATVGLSLNVRGLATAVSTMDACKSKLGLAIASLPHAVYYKSAGVDLEGRVHELSFRDRHVLPICDDSGAFEDFVKLHTHSKLPIFETLVLLSTEYLYQLEASGNVSAPKVGVLMKSLNDVAGIEGTLSGTLSFQPPRIIDAVLYALFVLYYLLLLVADLVPTLSWSSIWVSMIVVLSTAGLYGISTRLKNPFLDRGGAQNQRRGVKAAVLATERQVVGAMNSARLSGF